VKLDTTVSQTVAPGSTMTVGNQVATVADWQMRGTGTVTTDLRSVVPTSNAHQEASQTFEVAEGATKVRLTQSIKTTLKVTPG
jgi:hypothetical protein